MNAFTRAVQRSPYHCLVGVAGYEGILGHQATMEVLEPVRGFLREMRAVAERLVTQGSIDGDGAVVLSAGGSAFFDVVVEELSGDLPRGRPTELILRSGGYVAHDEGLYGEVSPFRRRPGLCGVSAPLAPAIEVWTRVLSRPEPELALVDAGKRDVPVDAALPVPLQSAATARPVQLPPPGS